MSSYTLYFTILRMFLCIHMRIVMNSILAVVVIYISMEKKEAFITKADILYMYFAILNSVFLIF